MIIDSTSVKQLNLRTVKVFSLVMCVASRKRKENRLIATDAQTINVTFNVATKDHTNHGQRLPRALHHGKDELVKITLTGGYACGKSVVAQVIKRELEKRGYVVDLKDERELMSTEQVDKIRGFPSPIKLVTKIMEND
jgi:hypothetical protein